MTLLSRKIFSISFRKWTEVYDQKLTNISVLHLQDTLLVVVGELVDSLLV